MSEQGGKFIRFFHSRWFIILVCILIAFSTFVFIRSYMQDRGVRDEIDRLKSEAASLEVKKFETMELLKYVKSPEFAEEKARTELNMIKPGEKTVIVKTGISASESSGQVDNKVIESNGISNPFKWWRLFTSN